MERLGIWSQRQSFVFLAVIVPSIFLLLHPLLWRWGVFKYALAPPGWFEVKPCLEHRSWVNQPMVVTAILLLLVGSYAPNVVSWLLFRWKPIVDVANRHRDIAEALYWIVKLFLIVGLIWILGKRYGDALWLHPAKVNGLHVLWAALVATPLAAYYLTYCFRMALAVARYSDVAPATLKPELEKAFTSVWAPLTNHPSASAIVLWSIVALAWIPLGTICLHGFALNRLRRKTGATCSVVVVAALLPATNFQLFSRPDQFVLVFLMALTLGVIRISTGSLGLAIGAGVGINFLVYLPKWMIAVFYYSVTHRLSG
jgi:hypothetical protein